jgi:alpha-glucosidase (family GH31 glycosyl hydrolase)
MYSYDIPLAGIWLQDWVGLRHSYDGDRLIWNWEVNPEWYPNWNSMVQSWKARDTRVLTYLNPFFSDPTNFTNSSRHNFVREGLENNYFIMNSSMEPYRMYSLSIEFYMLDLTNPAAVRWMKDIIKNYTILEAFSSGWMADFGEYLPFDAQLFSNISSSQYHNLYPQDWAQLNYEIIQEMNLTNEIFYFMRSGFMKSPKYNSIFWEGDQLVSWDEYDGLKNVIYGALSSGLCGHTITHSDIGGYNVNFDYNYVRNEEILSRWSELSAFGAGLFRTHIGSTTDLRNFQVYDTDSSLLHFKKFTDIYKELRDYRTTLIDQAVKSGLPLIRYSLRPSSLLPSFPNPSLPLFSPHHSPSFLSSLPSAVPMR